MNFTAYLDILKSHKILLLFCAFIFPIITGAYAYIVTPVYRATVLLAPVQDDGKPNSMSAIAGQLGGLATLAGLGLNTGGDIQVAIATLNSRKFTEEFINDNNLMPLLFENKWDDDKKTWKVESSEIPSTWDAFKKFNKIRRISETREPGLYRLSVTWKDPTVAAMWANELVARINERIRNDALKLGGRNLEYLQEQLSKTSVVEVQQSIFGLVESEMKSQMLANVSKEYVFRVIDPAVQPEEILYPKRGQLIILGLLVGILLGVFISFAHSYIKAQTTKQNS